MGNISLLYGQGKVPESPFRRSPRRPAERDYTGCVAQAHGLAWQASLFDTGDTGVDADFTGLQRHEFADGAWVDEVRQWVRGADELFAELLELTPWRQRDIWMYERRVAEPRLTHSWHFD